MTSTRKKAAPNKKATTKKKASLKNKSPSTDASIKSTVTSLRTSKCKTLTNRNTLSYRIGADSKGAVFLCVADNTGGGQFSKEWVPYKDIRSALAGHPKGSPITSLCLFPLFKGKSVNTPGYLLAVLVQEGLLKPLQGKKRHFHWVGDETFTAKVDKLKASKKKA